MTRRPKLPMTPQALPQQRLSLVVGLPERPKPFRFGVGYGKFPRGVVPRQGVPRSPVFLVQTEWAQTPNNYGVEAYYLQARKAYWVLWMRTLDDNEVPWTWHWREIGYCQRRGVSQAVAARHLMLEFWKFKIERDGGDIDGDPFDWIDGEGLLSVADVRAIQRALKADPPTAGR